MLVAAVVVALLAGTVAVGVHAGVHRADPALTMAFSGLLVVAGGFVVVGTGGVVSLVGLALLVVGVAAGAAALAGERRSTPADERKQSSTAPDPGADPRGRARGGAARRRR